MNSFYSIHVHIHQPLFVCPVMRSCGNGNARHIPHQASCTSCSTDDTVYAHQEIPVQTQLVWSLLGGDGGTHSLTQWKGRSIVPSICAPITTTTMTLMHEYNIMPFNIAYLKRPSKGEWVLLLWARQPAPCTNQSRHLKWRRSLQVFQRNNGAQQLLNTLSMLYNRNTHVISSNATTNHHVSFILPYFH